MYTDTLLKMYKVPLNHPDLTPTKSDILNNLTITYLPTQ